MKKITTFFFMMISCFCAKAQLATETFDTWPVGAGGWTTYQNEVGTNVQWGLSPLNSVPLPAYSEPHAAYMNRQNVPNGTPEDWLITKGFTSPTNAQLKFWSRLVLGLDQGTRYDIRISTNPDPASGAFVSLIDEDGWGELEVNPVQTQYIEKILPIPASYQGQTVYIAFIMKSANDGDRWLIDNVSVVAECLAPTSPTATSPTLNSATLNWGNPGNATQFEVEIIPAIGVPLGTGTIINQAPPYTPNNLSSGTAYKYYVRARCGDGNYSPWVGPVNFTTVAEGATCDAPKVITALPYSTTDNTSLYGDDIEGSPGAAAGCGATGNFLNGNEVVYSYTAGFTGAVTISMTGNGANSGMFVYTSCANIGVSCAAGGTGSATTPVILPSFSVTTGQTYYIVISTSGTTLSTPYTLVIQQENCAAPVGEPTTGITESNALLSWTNPSNAAAWEVALQPAGSPIPSGSGTVVFDHENVSADMINGPLSAGTQYQYYVRADCGDGTFSAWAGPYTFSTTICPPANQCNYSFVMTDNTAGWEGNTMTIRQNGIAVATIGSTFTTGTGPVTVTVPLCHDLPFELYWNAGGSFANEVGISIVNSFGQTIYTKPQGEGSQNSSLFNTVVDCLVPECLPPTDLYVNGQTMTSATLGWAGPATGSWEYVYMPATDPAPTATTTGLPTNNNPVTVNGLTAATNYKFYVRLLCASGDISPWAGPFNFSTTICPPADQCVYKFVMTDNYGGWEGNTMTITQGGINVTTIGSTFTSGTGPEIIEVPLCNGMPFELFWNNGGSFAFEVGIAIVNPFNQTLYTKEPGEGAAGTELYVGMVDCDTPACLPPTNIVSSEISTTSATITFDGPATGTWEYFVVPVTDPDPTDASTGTAVTTNPFTINTLTAAVNYKIFVRAVCASGNSPWSDVHNFNTKVCLPAEQCNYSFVMTDEAFGWDGNRMTISQNGVVVATIGSTFTTGTGPVTVTVPLCANVPFELFWTEQGSWSDEVGIKILDPFGEDLYYKAPGTGEQGTVLYTDVAYCVPPTCPKPQNLEVTALTQTSAMLGWQEQGTATTWQYVVLPQGSPAPTGDGTVTTQNPVPAGTLEPGTTYVFYVRADCGTADGFSTWSGPFQFTSLVSNDECENAVVVPVNPDAVCTQVGTGTVIGATASSQADTCFGTADDDVWFEFTAQATTHSITFQNIEGSTEDLYHVVYHGNDCGTLTQLYCSDDNSSYANGLTIGDVYKVKVYTYSDEPETSTFEICIKTPVAPILTSTTQYTLEQLVQDVLIGSDCAVVSNVTGITGSNFGESNGIGSFVQNGSDFPFEYGVVLSTGEVKEAEGPYPGNPGDFQTNAWPGDDDLQEIIAVGGNTDPLRNATILEFDFIPIQDHIEFKFLFASNEYGQYQCNYSDAFAFLLTGPGGVAQNLAVIPGTDIPVSVVNIRDEQYNPDFSPDDCVSQNVEWFGQFNELNPEASSIGYGGQTTEMTASADVVPGQVYHIKLVIADYRDSGVNSAVFLKGGSLQLGEVDLGGDLLVSQGNAVCAGGSATLDSQLNPANYEFVWKKGGVDIPGETSPVLVVDEPGVYTLVASYIGSTCSSESTVTIEFYPDVEDITGSPSDLQACSINEFAEFDFGPNTTAILGSQDPADFTITYHASVEDAENNASPLDMMYTNTTANQQVIYVRIVNNDSGCMAIKSFTLNVDPRPIITTAQGCEGGKYILEVLFTDDPLFNADNTTIVWSSPTGEDIGNEATVRVTEAGDYTVTVSTLDGVCSSVLPVQVTSTGCMIQRGISPNGDGLNDSLDLNGFNVTKLSIFNRYGREVYSYSNYTDQWHGQEDSGNELPTGTYFYNIQQLDGKNTTGWIYVNREEN